MSHLVHHIARGTTISPFISMTRSFGIACGYALNGRRAVSSAQPGYVYQIVIEENDGHQTKLLDPIVEIASQLQSPYEWKSYHHDGEGSFLLGVVDPLGHCAALRTPARFPPGQTPTPRAPQLHTELEAMVRSLRDAEVLAEGSIAKQQVVARWKVV